MANDCPDFGEWFFHGQPKSLLLVRLRFVAYWARITQVLDSLVGPLGFEPRTDGLKVSGSSLKTAPKQHGKRTKNARKCRFQAKTA